MAGAGYKLFNTGDVLLASEVNTYLQQQTVMVFASSAARTTALSGVLAEGMMSYLQDTNSVEVYNGSSWVNVGNAGDITGVTAGTGISGGGSSGDVTITNSMATAIDAKGDLIVGTGADTFSRLAVGTNDYVLTAASGEATGLKWAAPSSPSFVGVSASNTTGQTMSNGTYTRIDFDDEKFDTDGMHSNTTNNSRFTIPSGKGGKWLVNADVLFDSNTSGYRLVRLYKNGSQSTDVSGLLDSDGYTGIMWSRVVEATAGDYFEIYGLQNSGGSLNIDAGIYLRFQMTYLGA